MAVYRSTRPTEFQLGPERLLETASYLKTSTAFGPTIPPSLLARADQVIE